MIEWAFEVWTKELQMRTTAISVATPIATPTRQPLGYRNGAAARPDTSDWLDDPLKAIACGQGPYTVADLEVY